MKSLAKLLLLIFIPLLVSYAGTFLNVFAIAQNNGLMPAYGIVGCIPDVQLDLTHICAGPSTQYGVFCDWIPLGAHIWSIGDLLMIVGELGWLLAIIFCLIEGFKVILNRKSKTHL